jgi:RNA polymerase sigma-70 factor (ECF subfamily)
VNSETNTGLLLDHLFRHQAGRITAHLTRLLGPAHIDVAEEAVQEAMLRAMQSWPYHGIPENPAAWLFRAAHNASIDVVRHRRIIEEKRETVIAEITRSAESSTEDPDLEQQLRDGELRMIFMCCHPEIAAESRVALSLKTVGGFSVREIAGAFFSDERAIAQRLVRAKRVIRERRLTLRLPRGPDLQQRVGSVLQTIYFIFSEGYASHEGKSLIRQDLCFEALRLGELLASSSLASPEVHALMSLMALQAARLPARVDEAGDLVLLEDQDRARWDDGLIALGFHHFDKSISGDCVSEYHIQAAIAAEYARSMNLNSVDWPVILKLYDDLAAMSGSPIVALNRSVAVARVHGPASALAEIETLGEAPSLQNYYLYLAVRGHLLLQLGRKSEAALCFRDALACHCSEPERRFLARKLEECGG